MLRSDDSMVIVIFAAICSLSSKCSVFSLFTCGEVRARKSRDDNRTSCLIYVKEAIRAILQSNLASALRLCGVVVKALDSGS